jgi:hypothetical protein
MGREIESRRGMYKVVALKKQLTDHDTRLRARPVEAGGSPDCAAPTKTEAVATSVSLFRFHKSRRPLPSTAAKRAENVKKVYGFGLPDFSRYNIPNRAKVNQLPQNVQNCHKILP